MRGWNRNRKIVRIAERVKKETKWIVQWGVALLAYGTIQVSIEACAQERGNNNHRSQDISYRAPLCFQSSNLKKVNSCIETPHSVQWDKGKHHMWKAQTQSSVIRSSARGFLPKGRKLPSGLSLNRADPKWVSIRLGVAEVASHVANKTASNSSRAERCRKELRCTILQKHTKKVGKLLCGDILATQMGLCCCCLLLPRAS